MSRGFILTILETWRQDLFLTIFGDYGKNLEKIQIFKVNFETGTF